MIRQSTSVTSTTSTVTTTTMVNFTTAAGYTPTLYQLVYESSFCECDLTAQYCDANCCCDPYCSPSDTALFHGGEGCVQAAPVPFEHSCNFDWDGGHPARREVITTDLRRMLCVLRENNPLAGNFHAPRATLPATEEEIDAILVTTDAANSYPVKAPPATYTVSPRNRTAYQSPAVESPPPTKYTSGAKIPTSNVNRNLFGEFTIPTPFISGSCSDNAVSMLSDVKTSCTRVRAEVQKDCSPFGKLDAKLYMYVRIDAVQLATDIDTLPFIPVWVRVVLYTSLTSATRPPL